MSCCIGTHIWPRLTFCVQPYAVSEALCGEGGQDCGRDCSPTFLADIPHV